MIATIIVAAVIVVLMLGIGGAMTTVGPWYRGLQKPRWNPPDWLFGPAWTLILGLAAWSGVLSWMNAPSTASHLLIGVTFSINIALHMLWSPLFFNLQRPDWALIEIPILWLSIAALMVIVSSYSTLAPWLLLPYLLWVAFAAILNANIVRLNHPFGTDRAG
jgi:benzodiazapine receptor